ncbi:hypothetical protein [Flavobacterium sp. 3HN19-14]|uniref:hypothetical protein n=1 Tax=Flavobacterium sp. 3HN19-14 TaxID=3448133 RepID=UPI003EDFD538
MKNSITMLVIALTTSVFANTTNAATSKVSDISAVTISPKHSFYNDLEGTKYVSYADANLIATELGSLKKSPKTMSDIIGADLKITEAKLDKKVVLKKKTSKKTII